MTRLAIAVAVLTVVAIGDFVGAMPARADAWGCSYEKCLAYCTKVGGGGRCGHYCTGKLRDKQLSKVCPAS
jgi:hypothetical protein